MKTFTQSIATILVGVVLCTLSGCEQAPSNAWKPKSPKEDGGAKSSAKDVLTKSVPTLSKPPVVKKSEDDKLPPTARKPVVARKPKDMHVADFALTERSGRTVRRADLLGKPWVACFIFTHCAGFCTNISSRMLGVQEFLKAGEIDGVTIVTISVDPMRDTPEVLRRYAASVGADKKRWLFLTGKKEDIFHLIRDGFGQTVFDVEGEIRRPGFEVEHTDAVMLVDERGRVVKKYNALNVASIERLKSRLQHWKETGTLKIASTRKTNEDKGGGAK